MDHLYVGQQCSNNEFLRDNDNTVVNKLKMLGIEYLRKKGWNNVKTCYLLKNT